VALQPNRERTIIGISWKQVESYRPTSKCSADTIGLFAGIGDIGYLLRRQILEAPDFWRRKSIKNNYDNTNKQLL